MKKSYRFTIAHPGGGSTENVGSITPSQYTRICAILDERTGTVTMEDPILIPRGLIGAACSAIDKQRPAEKLLAKLREYTFGAKSGIDTPIDKPIDIAPDFVNVEAVHDYEVGA